MARITGELTRPGPLMGPALAFAKAHTRRPVKVTLPGPMTLVDTTLDEHYRGDEESLAMRFAALLNAEARDLAASGAPRDGRAGGRLFDQAARVTTGWVETLLFRDVKMRVHVRAAAWALPVRPPSVSP